MKIQGSIVCAFVLLLASSTWSQDQKRGSEKAAEVSVNRNGNSSLETEINGTAVRIVIATHQIDIGKQEKPPDERENNCTYSSFPCSQVSSLRIWVKGTSLFIPRSVIADCTDVGNMRLATDGKAYVLTLAGGDASEAYEVRIFFTTDEVKKREMYDLESNSLRQSTTYMPPPVVE